MSESAHKARLFSWIVFDLLRAAGTCAWGFFFAFAALVVANPEVIFSEHGRGHNDMLIMINLPMQAFRAVVFALLPVALLAGSRLARPVLEEEPPHWYQNVIAVISHLCLGFVIFQTVTRLKVPFKGPLIDRSVFEHILERSIYWGLFCAFALICGSLFYHLLAPKQLPPLVVSHSNENS